MFVSGPKVMDKEMYPLAWSSGKTVHVVSEEPLASNEAVKSVSMLLGGPSIH